MKKIEMKGWMSEPVHNAWLVLLASVVTAAFYMLQDQDRFLRFIVLILYFVGMYLCDLSVKEYKTLHPNTETHDPK